MTKKKTKKLCLTQFSNCTIRTEIKTKRSDNESLRLPTHSEVCLISCQLDSVEGDGLRINRERKLCRWWNLGHVSIVVEETCRYSAIDWPPNRPNELFFIDPFWRPTIQLDRSAKISAPIQLPYCQHGSDFRSLQHVLCDCQAQNPALHCRAYPLLIDFRLKSLMNNFPILYSSPKRFLLLTDGWQ